MLSKTVTRSTTAYRTTYYQQKYNLIGEDVAGMSVYIILECVHAGIWFDF